MTKASDNEFPSVLFDEQGSNPSTPGSGLWRAYFKSDGLYIIDDAGVVTGPLGTGGGGGGGNVPTWVDLLDTAASADASDDEFDDSSLTGWTLVSATSSTETATEDADVLSIKVTSAIGSSKANAYLKAIPATPTAPITIETATRVVNSRGNNRFVMHGPLFTDGATTGAGIYFGHLHHNGDLMRSEVHSGTLASLGSSLGSTRDFNDWPLLYQRVTWDSTNTFEHEVSGDGVSWISVNGTQSKTLTPTHFGFAWSNWDNAEDRILTVEYFRVS